MKNKKGFTLIELLAVIVVLAIILVIAGTNVIKYINSTKENAKFIAAKEIVNIAEAYMEANDRDYINVKDLIDEGYLEEDATNPKTGENGWNGTDAEKQYILKTLETAQTDSEAINGSYYNFDGFTFSLELSQEQINNLSSYYSSSNSTPDSECEGIKIKNGWCIITEDNRLADDTTTKAPTTTTKAPTTTTKAPTTTTKALKCADYTYLADIISSSYIKYISVNGNKNIAISVLNQFSYSKFENKNPIIDTWESQGFNNLIIYDTTYEEKTCVTNQNGFVYTYNNYQIMIATKKVN